MDFISSKSIFFVIRDTLKLIDADIMKHGSRTGYILYKMLECKGGFEKFELAELAMLGTLHDIGAYQTQNPSDMLSYEAKNTMPHSIYGYLFLKHLSPMEANSQILLYHHTDYNKMQDIPENYKNLANYLNLAEKIDIYNDALGKDFNDTTLEKHIGIRYSEEAFALYRKVRDQDNLFEKIRTGQFEEELDELMDYIIFTNEEKVKYMYMLMYCLGFRNAVRVMDSVVSVCICEQLGKKFELDEMQSMKLYYGALLHDIGMLGVPKEIIESNRRLTPQEMEIMHNHVAFAEQMLSDRVDPEVLAIACRHHERVGGMGYPKGLKESEMNLSQNILQIADTVVGLTSVRPYKLASTKEEVIHVLIEGAKSRMYNPHVVKMMIEYFDDIMEDTRKSADEFLVTHKKLKAQFDLVYEKYKQ